MRFVRIIGGRPDFSVIGMRYDQLLKSSTRENPSEIKRKISPDVLLLGRRNLSAENVR